MVAFANKSVKKLLGQFFSQSLGVQLTNTCNLWLNMVHV